MHLAAPACAASWPVGSVGFRMAMAPLEDAMTRYAAGDDAALGDVYDRLAPQLVGFLRRMSRDPALAEDLTHETFLRIVRARGLYRPGADVRAWSYAIGRRLFLDAIRARRRVVSSLDDPSARERPSDPGIPSVEPRADDQLIATRLAESIDRVLAGIPESQATAFRLLKQEGLSVGEAALVVGATETAVKLRAHRAYEAIRETLGESWELPERRERGAARKGSS